MELAEAEVLLLRLPPWVDLLSSAVVGEDLVGAIRQPQQFSLVRQGVRVEPTQLPVVELSVLTVPLLLLVLPELLVIVPQEALVGVVVELL